MRMEFSVYFRSYALPSASKWHFITIAHNVIKLLGVQKISKFTKQENIMGEVKHDSLANFEDS